MAVITCVSMSNFGEAGAMLTQMRKTLRHGFRDGSILGLLYNDGIVGYLASGPSSSSSSTKKVSERRESGGKQANATEDSNFFTSGFGGEGTDGRGWSRISLLGRVIIGRGFFWPRAPVHHAVRAVD